MTGPSGLVVEVASVFNPSTKLGNPGGRWSRTFAVYRSTGLFLGDHSISQILHIPIRYHVSPEYLFWQQKHLCLRSFLAGYCCCGDGPIGGIHGKKKFIVDFQLLFGLLKLLLFIGSVGTLAIIFAILHLTVGDIFASFLAFAPTGWGILQISQASIPPYRWPRHLGCGDLSRLSRGGTGTRWGSSSSSRWQCWHGSHLSRDSRRECYSIRPSTEGLKTLVSWLAARSKGDVSTEGDIRRNRLISSRIVVHGCCWRHVCKPAGMLTLSEF
ncbi:hypothetical protein GQ55_9G592300 [Panicum hallii var. hallii]|uniref:Uncharacterized protein n=1 Tax=Panicum hallii var. hallii TaxID=1504633 RepID=A0A2T7CGT5_9POAL|nr:hypothetical protein GQ55_9G592300 [Panicum hallii var. hallii]